MKLLLCASLLAMSHMITHVEGFSSGAPIEACETLSPNPTRHRGANPQNTTAPYSVNISAFLENGTYFYYPGRTYTLTVSGNSGEQFRGFFVQARLLSNDSTRVGAFIVTGPLSRLSSCSPNTDGITHNSSVDKTIISFDWTAPPLDMGPIRFGYAVVQQRIIYWADQRTAIIQGVGSTVGTTQVSPGNGSSGLYSSVSTWALGVVCAVVLALVKL